MVTDLCCIGDKAHTWEEIAGHQDSYQREFYYSFDWCSVCGSMTEHVTTETALSGRVKQQLLDSEQGPGRFTIKIPEAVQ